MTALDHFLFGVVGVRDHALDKFDKAKLFADVVFLFANSFLREFISFVDLSFAYGTSFFLRRSLCFVMFSIIVHTFQVVIMEFAAKV